MDDIAQIIEHIQLQNTGMRVADIVAAVKAFRMELQPIDKEDVTA